MEKQVCKILPDGQPSGLSLNQYQVRLSKATRWNGCLGKDVYSLESMKKKILKIFPQYESVRDFDVFGFLQKGYSSEPELQSIIAETVDGLGDLITSLCEGSTLCKECNENLFDSDWAFWKRCRYIILDGKFLYGEAGNDICSMLSQKLFRNHRSIQVLKLSDFTDVRTPSLLGCAYGHAKNNGEQYVFDFGNSAVKRGRARCNQGKILIDERSPIYHDDFWNLEDTMETAKELDDFILDIILQTIAEFQEHLGSSYNIGMCIANNILSNRIADRGSYRFLRMISADYQEHLSKRLSGKLSAPVALHMYNDAEAVGRIFSGFSPDTAIITLGTHMGVAYPPGR